MKIYEEGIIGGKTAPEYNGTGVGDYVDALLESTAKQKQANMNNKFNIEHKTRTVPLSNATNGYGGVPSGMTTGTISQPQALAKEHGGMSNVQTTNYGTQYTYADGTGYWDEKPQAKPTMADANSPIAYEKAKQMQQRMAQQNANATEAQKARPVIDALLNLIYKDGGEK